MTILLCCCLYAVVVVLVVVVELLGYLERSLEPPIVPAVDIGENPVFIFEAAIMAGSHRRQYLRLPNTTHA